MKPLAILSSDWHLRVTTPQSRAEPDWFTVMRDRMEYMQAISSDYNVPIIVAGDIFDRWNPPSELVSWCMDHMPSIWAIPGQHDLPQHRLEARSMGAYGALEKAGRIHNLPAGEWTHISKGLCVYAMPWGAYDPPKLDAKDHAKVRLGVMHKYAWVTKETGYVGAADSDNVASLSWCNDHFDAVVIGDNHIPWKAGKFFNHGSLFSTTKAQIDHEPREGLLMEDGSIQLLPCTEQKKWVQSVLDEVGETQKSQETEALMSELASLSVDSISFEDVIKRLENESNPGPREIFRELRDHIYRK